MYINFRTMYTGLATILIGLGVAAITTEFVPPHVGFVVSALLIITFWVQFFLGLYGLNILYLLYRSILAGDNHDESLQSLKQWGDKPWPHVTVQLPIYNERFVIERLLERCVEFDYPTDKLEIQVLDDSTDGTADIVRACIERLNQRTKVRITHLTRRSRSHFKAGALVLGTAQARGEFLAIFDADFLPTADFLKRTIPRFSNPQVGCVQCRWGHINFDHSLITKLQAIGHDGHFIIEQHAKSTSGFTLNFNGTAGVWRRQCIVDAGDWSGDTLAEDLDLSYRAQLKGWKIDYLRDVEVKAEIPLSISAFKKQQARWAKGSIQGAIKLLPLVWDSRDLTNGQKLQATIHLCGYGVHPIMVLNLLVTISLFFLTPVRAPEYVLYFTCLLAVGPPLEITYAQLWQEKPWRVLLMPLLILLHHGLCLNNCSAVFEAFNPVNKGVFERTPKFGSMENWANTNYAKALKSVGFPLAEILMCILLLTCILVGCCTDLPVNAYAYPWLYFFLAGFGQMIFFHFHEAFLMSKHHESSKAAQQKVL